MNAKYDNAPVGVYDSGLGGLTVWREIRRALPAESLVYLGDGANCPYGSRPREEVRRLADAAVGRLAEAGCKLVVVACNTATAAAIDFLREKGQASAAKKQGRIAAEGIVDSYIHMGGKVGVLLSIKAGKEETVKSDAFKALAKDLTLHIAAAAPKSVSSDSLDPAFVAEEQEIAKQQLIQEGKPEHLLEKILPGKLKALYAQSCLLNQGFVKDPNVTVDALLKQVGKELGDDVSVVSFVRYQLGA